MPYKHNETHRAKIPKARYPVTNWPDYDRGLVRRGSLRFRVDEAVIRNRAAVHRQRGRTLVGVPDLPPTDRRRASHEQLASCTACRLAFIKRRSEPFAQISRVGFSHSLPTS